MSSKQKSRKGKKKLVTNTEDALMDKFKKELNINEKGDEANDSESQDTPRLSEQSQDSARNQEEKNESHPSHATQA